MANPLPIPNDFNPETHMLGNPTDDGVLHQTRRAAGFAANLVTNGTPEDLALAEKVLDALLACQETREDDPHYGNFKWYREDDFVEDLNAVAFNLTTLIPLAIHYGGRLSKSMYDRLLDAIRLGLHEVKNLDVQVAYTNIAIKDIVNTCLGGELLNDPEIAQRGYQKLIDWMTFTDTFGIPFEYNSPTYYSVAFRSFKNLASLTQDSDTRIRARTAIARLGISVALHIHTRTGRWAGPHSRAYHPTVVAETAPEAGMVRNWIEEGALPGWITDVLTHRPASFEVSETAHIERCYGLTTHHSPAFALGVSTKQYTGQSNALIAHYHRPNADRAGVLYTRYLLNDKWLGDFYHQTDRSTSRNLVDEGQFYGVQQGPRAIGLYAPGTLGRCTSAKAAFIWTQYEHIDEIWIGNNPVKSLPADIPEGETVVIASGEALFAVRPLTRTDLGRNAPLRLIEREGDLVLEIYNYHGPAKSFWEMRWPGLFYKGKPQCGIYLEIAERSAYPDSQSFGQTVAGGTLNDNAEAPYVYSGEGERLWSIEYTRDGQTLGIEVDLMEWQLKRRWTQSGELGWPMLESPVARQTRTGEVTVGNATLTCGSEPAWLFACPETGRYVAGYHGQTPAPLSLTIPAGRVEIEAMGVGTVHWNNGIVTVETIALKGTPKIIGGRYQPTEKEPQ